MENRFCYLKGLVECDSGRIQDCNNKRAVFCPLEKEKKFQKESEKSGRTGYKRQQGFCFLKGLVDCSAGRIQDCNIKRVKQCPLDDKGTGK